MVDRVSARNRPPPSLAPSLAPPLARGGAADTFLTDTRDISERASEPVRKKGGSLDATLNGPLIGELVPWIDRLVGSALSVSHRCRRAAADPQHPKLVGDLVALAGLVSPKSATRSLITPHVDGRESLRRLPSKPQLRPAGHKQAYPSPHSIPMKVIGNQPT